MSWGEDILNKINEWWDGIMSSLSTEIGKGISSIYKIDVKLFGINFSTDDMYGTIASLTNFDKTKTLSIYTIGKTINELVVPVALSLLTLFFMISLIKRFAEIEKVGWERVLLWGCYFFLIKAFVQRSYSLLTTIMGIVNNIYVDVSNALSVGSGVSSISQNVANAFKNYTSLGNILFGILLYVILAIPFIGSIIQIWAQVLLRVVKLMLCMAFSPIPLAMAVEGETYRGKAISYFMYAAGVGFESIVILLGSWIYTQGLSSVSKMTNAFPQIIGVLVMNALFVAIIQLSHEFSERIFGRT